MLNDYIAPEQKAEDLAEKAAALEIELATETDSARQKALEANIKLQRGLEQFHRGRVASAQAVIVRQGEAPRYKRMQKVKLAD